MVKNQRSIAYFSMEIGLDTRMPTYSRGLGVLAGDTIRSSADLKVPLAAVTLLYLKGYFRQRLEEYGWQREEPVEWIPGNFMQEEPQRISEWRVLQYAENDAAVCVAGVFVKPLKSL